MGTFEERFTLHVLSSTENLAEIRAFVTRIGVMAGATDAELSQMELAVDEACANIMEHAYKLDSTQELVIRVTFDEEELEIELEDKGPKFDPREVPKANVERLVAQRKRGGLGLTLITKLMDEVEYARIDDSKNRLRMVKRLKRTRSEADGGDTKG